MSKISLCKADLVMRCISQLADIACKYYRENRREPLKCAYRCGVECTCTEACRDAAKGLVSRHAGLLITD